MCLSIHASIFSSSHVMSMEVILRFWGSNQEPELGMHHTWVHMDGDVVGNGPHRVESMIVIIVEQRSSVRSLPLAVPSWPHRVSPSCCG